MDARYVKSREALMNASIDMLIRNPGASMSDIASYAGVGRATLYRHFPTKDELIKELAKEALRVTDEVLDPLRDDDSLTGRLALEKSIHAIMPLADRFHFLLSLWNVAEEDQEIQAVYDRQLAELSTLIEQAKQANEIRENLSTDWLVVSFDALLAASWWMVKYQGCSHQLAADQMIGLFFDGVAV